MYVYAYTYSTQLKFPSRYAHFVLDIPSLTWDLHPLGLPLCALARPRQRHCTPRRCGRAAAAPGAPWPGDAQRGPGEGRGSQRRIEAPTVGRPAGQSH